MFWPTASRWPSVLRVAVDQPRDVAFEPNGKWIAASSRKGGVEIWPTTPDGPPRQVLAAGMQTGSVAISPDGQLVAAGTFGGVVLSSPSAERPTRLQGFSAFVWTVAFDRSGTRIAAAGAMQGRRGEVAAVFDLRTGAMKVLDAGEGAEKIGSVAFLPDGALLVASLSGLRRFDIESGMFDRLLDESVPVGLPSPDGRHALLLRSDNLNVPSGSAAVYDLQQRRVWPLTRHGDQVSLMAWDPTGRRVVTGSRDGIVRVGPMTDEEPHLLIGHEAPIWGVRVDSTGRSVASASEDGTVRIWPMPDGQPLHTWPHELLLDKLRSLTNVRVIPDASVASGYRASFEPFQGWYLDPPTW
jgi:WD40 repeat protein